MISMLEMAIDEVLDPSVTEKLYLQASRQCENLCQVLGGIRDGQIQDILADSSELSQKTRVMFYWQLRLHFPNPYE